MALSELAQESAVVIDSPLSLQQEFLRLFDQGDAAGPFGPRYIVVDGWRVRGRIDLDALASALADVVGRHEALRTSVIRDPENAVQRITAAGVPEVVVRDLTGTPAADRDRRAEELLNEVEAGTFEVGDLPLLRAVLGRFADDEWVLVLITHHSAADAWSMQVIVGDLAECYAARAVGTVPSLPSVPQYREFAEFQRETGASGRVQDDQQYWRRRLDGARILVTGTDRASDPEVPPRTSWFRFVTEPGLRAALNRVAEETRSSPFMVLLAAFNVLITERTGATDIVVPTFAPGRGVARFQRTVGSFFNFVPLRTNVTGCVTFREAVLRTRSACLGAFTHELPLLQVLPEAPELMSSIMAPGVAPCLFQVIQPPFLMDRHRVGDLEYTALWRRVITQPVGSDIPDGMLWSLHLGPSEEIVGAVGYSAHLFDEATVAEFVDAYCVALRRLLTNPEVMLTAPRS